MNAYSKDLRIKALGAVDRGMPRKEAASTFGISLATLKRWLKQLGQERHADLLDHCRGYFGHCGYTTPRAHSR